MSLANLSERAALRVLGARLRTSRVDAGLTQAELATVSGVSRKHLVAIEGGRTSPGFLSVVKLCHALRIRLDGLISTEPPL